MQLRAAGVQFAIISVLFNQRLALPYECLTIFMHCFLHNCCGCGEDDDIADRERNAACRALMRQIPGPP